MNLSKGLASFYMSLNGPRAGLYCAIIFALFVPADEVASGLIADKVMPRATKLRSLTFVSHWSQSGAPEIVLRAPARACGPSLTALELVGTGAWDEVETTHLAIAVRLRSFTNLSALRLNMKRLPPGLLDAITASLHFESLKALNFECLQLDQPMYRLLRAIGSRSALERLIVTVDDERCLGMLAPANAGPQLTNAEITWDKNAAQALASPEWIDNLAGAGTLELLYLDFERYAGPTDQGTKHGRQLGRSIQQSSKLKSLTLTRYSINAQVAGVLSIGLGRGITDLKLGTFLEPDLLAVDTLSNCTSGLKSLSIAINGLLLGAVGSMRVFRGLRVLRISLHRNWLPGEIEMLLPVLEDLKLLERFTIPERVPLTGFLKLQDALPDGCRISVFEEEIGEAGIGVRAFEYDYSDQDVGIDEQNKDVDYASE